MSSLLRMDFAGIEMRVAVARERLDLGRLHAPQAPRTERLSGLLSYSAQVPKERVSRKAR